MLADGEIAGNDTKGGGCFKNEALAAGKVLGLSLVSIECLEIIPGNVGATIENTSAEDLGLEGKVFAMGSTSMPNWIVDLHEIIKSSVDSESETNTAKVIEADGETSEVKTVTDTTFMLLPLADKSEYFSDPTFCTARSRDDAKDSGITSATEPLSGRTEI